MTDTATLQALIETAFEKRADINAIELRHKVNIVLLTTESSPAMKERGKAAVMLLT